MFLYTVNIYIYYAPLDPVETYNVSFLLFSNNSQFHEIHEFLHLRAFPLLKSYTFSDLRYNRRHKYP